jgi:hypothetical protein
VKTILAKRIGALAPAILLLSGCGHGLDEAMMKQASRQGVYVQTSSKLVEVSRYGAYNLDPFTQQIEFKFDSSISPVAGPIAFVTNIPEATMGDAKVFLLPSIGAGVWHKNLATSGDTKPLSSSTDAISGSIYKVTPDLPSDATGFLCLWLKMPAGAGDRMYAVQITK